MSLGDLSQYAPAQGTAINRLTDSDQFIAGAHSLAWTEFKASSLSTGSSFPLERSDREIILASWRSRKDRPQCVDRTTVSLRLSRLLSRLLVAMLPFAEIPDY